jgi:REP element-mobilizing transposase RayT
MKRIEPHTPRGWHARGYLPHYDGGEELPQSVTFRLADSVPEHLLIRWENELRGRPETTRELELYRLIETFLDTGYGACHLGKPDVAQLVEDALLHFDGPRYLMHAWVVMPNHVHALFTPTRGWSLSDISQSWKSFTSKEANKLLGRTGRFWQGDYFDRYIRDGGHFNDVLDYIERNPVKAGLSETPEEWTFGSARFRSTDVEVEAGQRPALQKGTQS